MATPRVVYDVEALVRDPETISVADGIAATRAGREPDAIERIALESASPEQSARETLTIGWERTPNPRVKMDLPISWDELCGASRSWTFHLHAWDPMADPLTVYGASKARPYLVWCLALALDWVGQHPARLANSPFAWYDMAVGMRAYRLAYLIDIGARESALKREDLIVLVASLRVHLSVLSNDSQFRAHSNHGIYQAAGQMVAALRLPELPEAAAAASEGLGRLQSLMQRHFDEDGVHLEHSPGYHLMVLRSLLRLRTVGIIRDPELLATLNRAENAMSWFVAPVGTLPTVGDTDRLAKSTLADDNVAEPALLFALSQGRAGTAPAETSRVFESAGYVVARDGWFSGAAFASSSYLLQSCGFHSRVHKHADDLSFVWYADGADLLADSGRYGYIGRTEPDSQLGKAGFYYSDPDRVYVESTRAHNCVEVDSRSYSRRSVKPYGSALLSASSDPATGLVTTLAAATHFRSVNHTRLLIHRPGHWLLVVDHAIGRAADRHRFVQRFQFGPELDLVEFGQRSLRFSIPGASRDVLAFQLGDANPVSPVRGQTEPELLGFVSRRPGELLPNWTAAWERHEVRAATFLALFVLAEPSENPTATGRSNATARVGRAGFVIAGERHTVNWNRSAEQVLVKYDRLPHSGP
jgi:hypothetical protein